MPWLVIFAVLTLVPQTAVCYYLMLAAYVSALRQGTSSAVLFMCERRMAMLKATAAQQTLSKCISPWYAVAGYCCANQRWHLLLALLPLPLLVSVVTRSSSTVECIAQLAVLGCQGQCLTAQTALSCYMRRCCYIAAKHLI